MVADCSLSGPLPPHSQRQCPAACERTVISCQRRLSPGLSRVTAASSEYLHVGQPQSSPWGKPLEPEPRTQPPLASAGMQTRVSGWEVLVGTHSCGEFCLSCLPSTCRCIALWGSKVAPRPHPWGIFRVRKLFPFRAPSLRRRSPIPLSLFFSSVFCTALFCGDYLAFSEVWALVPVFRRCPVGASLHGDVVLMCLGEESDLHTLLLNHLASPPKKSQQEFQGVWAFFWGW